MVKIKTLKSAYRKFKSFVYYDNSNLLLRQQLAEYESFGDIDKRLTFLFKKIINYNDNPAYWKKKIDDISYWKIVKQYQPCENDAAIISNYRHELEYNVDRINYFINAPIELHICSALWLMLIGFRLEPLLSEPPYGNKIDFYKEDGEIKLAKGLKLYKPYFYQYQKWRDGAVQSAKGLIDKEKNTLIIGLDIKNYYHSIRLDLDDIHQKCLPEEVSDELNNLCKIFKRIHKEYSSKLNINDDLKRVILPIGLISSGVIGNYYLDPMDKEFKEQLRPEYYARYVDDILIVTSCSDESKKLLLNKVAQRYLLDTGIFHLSEDNLYTMTSEGYETITIQQEKLSVLHFVSGEPTALLDKFIADLKKNSSEYRLLPEDEVVNYDFDEAAYNLKYSGTGNKFRDIKEFGEDKFGISKYLAKKIFLALQSGHRPDKKAVRKIINFFKGRHVIELFTLWEKIFTFLLVNKSYNEIVDITLEILSSVEKIKPGKACEWDDNSFYIKHLFTSISMALSLKPSVINESESLDKLKEIFDEIDIIKSSFKKSIKAFRKSNLIRHNYVVHPLLNYVDSNHNDEFFDLLDYSYYFKIGHRKLKIEEQKYRYSPRFVHYYEVTLFHIINRCSAANSKFYHSGFLFGSRRPTNAEDYLDESFADYYCLNYQRRKPPITNKPQKKKICKELFELEKASKNNSNIRNIRAGKNIGKKSLKIAIANISLPEEVISHEYLRRPHINPERRKIFNSILNQAENEKADILVMPEISVPVAWFKWVSDYALRKQRGLVFGLEHWIVGKKAFNFIVTMMPIKLHGFKSLIIDIRLKNHYSPAEIEILKGYGYIIPEVANPSYDLFNWRGCYFTVFNCFELSNIEHRSRFKSKIDLLIASEFNKDVAYFSNIVESSSRDLHCYVTQVNDSKYGDSRICQPTKSIRKDIIKVKGGSNSTILAALVDFNKLREFQLKEYSWQMNNTWFKPTPPDFDKSNVFDRIKGK